MPTVRSGLEVLVEERLDLVRDRRVGLIANPACVDHTLRHAVELLLGNGVNLTSLFGPEHGFRGNVAAGVHVDSVVDVRTGIPIHSLYGSTKKPTPEMLSGVDVLLYDAQDGGARFLTGTSVMAKAMEAAGESGIPFIVLDRPNPLGGIEIEGPVLDPAVSSFVGLYPIPIRHGMTRGELARMLQGEFGLSVELTVVPMVGWERSMRFEQTGLPWVMTSPDMPSLDTVNIYPATCPFEGTSCSEGRGTTRPFELIGAPWMDGRAVADEMNALDLPGVRFREAFFTPTTSNMPCGMQVTGCDHSPV